VDYQAFLESKRTDLPMVGKDIDTLNSILFPFQHDIVKWAARRGRCAIFADCGPGKTFMQLEWARHMGKRQLIVAPLKGEREAVAMGPGNLKITDPELAYTLTLTVDKPGNSISITGGN